MLATMGLENAAQPQQMDNAAKSLSFKNNSTTPAQKNKGGPDFKDILAPKLEEKEGSSLDSLSAKLEELLGNKNSGKLKPGEAAEMVEALLKVLKVLRDKKAAGGKALPARKALPSADRSNLLNLFKRLEEFIKKGLKQGPIGEKDHFSRLKILGREIFSLITAGISAGGDSAAPENSENFSLSPASSAADLKTRSGGGPGQEVKTFTLVDLRKNRAAGKSAALTPASNSAPGKETALAKAVFESSGQGVQGELKNEPSHNSQLIVRTISFEPVEFKGGIEAGSTLSGAFRRLFIPEIVQQSRIILQDGGKGEINLILKPESLGRVRIKINIQGNSIVGRILVENNSVRELFEGNLEHLRNALRSEGFETAALEVAVGGEKAGRDPVKEEFPSMSKEDALDEFEKSMPLLVDFGEEDLLIDLVV